MNDTVVRKTPKDWFTILGEANPHLEAELNERMAGRIAKEDFNLHNVRYIEDADFSLIDGKLAISDERLEKLRNLCQLWNVRIRPAEISSHRKYIGPLIVASKKMMFRLISVLMKDVMHQQRSFNASAVSLIAELSSDSASEKNDSSDI